MPPNREHFVYLIFATTVLFAIISYVPIWLGYDLPEDFHALKEAINSDKLVPIFWANIVISFPMIFELLVDIIGYFIRAFDQNTIFRRKIADCIREWIIRVMFIYGMSMPAILGLATHDFDRKAVIYFCQNTMQNIVVSGALAFHVSKTGDPIWNIMRTFLLITLCGVSQITLEFATFHSNSTAANAAFIVYIFDSILLFLLLLASVYDMACRVFNRSKGENVLLVLTKEDLIISTYGGTVITLFVASQVYGYLRGQINFSDSDATTLRMYSIFYMAFIVIVAAIPARISRYDLSRTQVRLNHLHV
jgi:hypothetical protein